LDELLARSRRLQCHSVQLKDDIARLERLIGERNGASDHKPEADELDEIDIEIPMRPPRPS
jgi:hypothetical protein